MPMRKNPPAAKRAEQFFHTAQNFIVNDRDMKRLVLVAEHKGRHVILSTSPLRPDTTIADVMELFILTARHEDENKQFKLKVEMLDRKITVQF